MRIDRISIRGLASLRDPQPAIELASAAFADAGLIAVTGPTGAGKSTIFDAVCLALYDATPRLPGRAADPRELLSRGAASARVEVHLTLDDGSRLLAIWATNRARDKLDGRLQASDQEIRDPVSGAILAGGKREVAAYVQQRLGLSFDQFRSVALLSQGDFARFISASGTEKAELLEKLTGTALYAQVSILAHQRHAAMEQEIATHQARLGAIALLGDDERQQRHAELSGHQAAIAAVTAEMQALTNQQAWWRTLVQLIARTQVAHTARITAEAAVAASTDRRARRDQARQAQALAGLLATAEAEAAAVDRSVEQERKAQTAVPAALAARDQARAALDQAIARSLVLVQCVYAERDRQGGLARISAQIQGELHGLVGERTAAKRALEERQAAGGRCAIQVATAEAAAADASARRSAATLSATTARTAAEAAEAVWQQAMRAGDPTVLTGRAGVLEQAATVAEAGLKAESEAAALTQDLEAAELALVTARTAAADVVEALAQAETAREHQRQARESLLALAQVSAFRHLLVDGEPCPLCGACDHPAVVSVDESAAADAPVDLVAEADRQIARHTGLIRHLTSERAAREHTLQQCATTVARLHATADERQRQATARQVAWRELGQRWVALGSTGVLDPAGSDLERALGGTSPATASDQIAALRAQAQALCLQAAACDDLRNRRDLAVRAAAAADQALARAHADADAHQTAVTTARAALAQAEAASLAAAEHLAQLDQRLTHAVAGLADAIGEPTPVMTAVETWIADLGRRAQQWAGLVAAVELAEQVREQAIACAQPIGDGISTDDSGSDVGCVSAPPTSVGIGSLSPTAPGTLTTTDPAEIRRLLLNERTALTIAANHRQRADQTWTTALDAVAVAGRAVAEALLRRDQADAALDTALAGGPFADRVALKAALLPGDELAALDHALAMIDRDLHQAQATIADVRSELAHQRETAAGIFADGHRTLALAAAEAVDTESATTSDPASQALADLDLRITATAAERDAAIQRSGQLQAELDDDARRRLEHQAGYTVLDGLRRAMVPWADLDALIGHSSGNTFRQVAQAMVLDQLLALANRRLLAIAPRYALARQPAENDPHRLDLAVIDHDQADERRPVATLSGGETFLASLGLALALADLKRGSLRLGTLFIDEGFGTLDHDTLDQALGVLERLQAEQGTQILLISHVGALQERIRHQIRVVPQGSGLSRLRLLARDGDVTPEAPEAPTNSTARVADVDPADLQAVLVALAQAGNEASTRSLRQALGWDAPRLKAVTDQLLASGAVVRPAAGSKSLALPTG